MLPRSGKAGLRLTGLDEAHFCAYSRSMNITDDQIRTLRKEANIAGDHLQVAICNVALTEWPEIAEVGEHRAALEALGIYPALVDSDEVARALCVKAIGS